MIAAASISNRVLGCVNAPSLMQRVILRCVDEKVNLSAYNKNRELLYNSLTEYGFECIKPEGAFYLFIKTPEDDKLFCEFVKNTGFFWYREVLLHVLAMRGLRIVYLMNRLNVHFLHFMQLHRNMDLQQTGRA